MPYISIETNKTLDAAATETLLKETSAFFSSLLGKPESVIMVSLRGGAAMMFSKGLEPAAYVAVKSIGLKASQCAGHAKAVCAFIERALGIPTDRAYIDFAAIDGAMFGWNGRTFG